jgi:F-type H+-transporting ATPase subunit b
MEGGADTVPEGDFFSPLISFNLTLVMNWVTVIVLFLILKKFFFEKVHNFIVARQNAVQDAFDNAESMNRVAAERLDTYNKRIAEIEGEGRDIIQKAKIKADDQARRILDEAQQKADAMMDKTQKEIERERQKALSEMKGQVAALALMAAEKILEKDLEIEGQDAFVDQVIEQVGASVWQN